MEAGWRGETELSDGYIILVLQIERSQGVGVGVAAKQCKCNIMSDIDEIA